MAQPPLPSAARRNQTLRFHSSARQCQGVSLTELLIGMVISIVVLGAAVRVLVSLIRGDGATQVEINRKDDVGRVLGLMQDEVRNAQRVESGASLTALASCSTTPLLILRGATANEDISYGLRIQSANTAWRGPNVLVRCGPDYSTDPVSNQPVLNTTTGRREQEVLDSLASSGFTASTLGGTGAISRSVQLSLISSASGTSITNSLQVPINTNQVYGLTSSGATACPDGTGSISTGCADPNGDAIHYKPTLGGSDITGTPNIEDVFYFDGKRSDYNLNRTPGSGQCTTVQCTVRQGNAGSFITLFDADVLVFRDMQIRL